MTHVAHINGCVSAVYVSYMSQKLPFASLIEFVRSEHSFLSPHIPAVADKVCVLVVSAAAAAAVSEAVMAAAAEATGRHAIGPVRFKVK